MANELPYFRFTVQAWQNGKIDIERYELKGLFITICGYYWIQDCDLTLDLLKKKFNNDVKLIDELIDLGILKYEKRHNRVSIEFLNIQYDLLSEKRKTNVINGSKGGKAKANAKQTLERNPSYKDNIKISKDNNKDKDKSVFDFKNSLLEYGFSEKLINDWLVVRKNKKASNTESAYNGFIKEVEKRSVNSLDFILQTCCEKSWSGFKWEWIDNLETNNNGKQGNKNSNSASVDALNDAANEILRNFKPELINRGIGE